MNPSRILTAFVLVSIGLLIAPEPQHVFACKGSSTSVCVVTTTACLKSMVLTKSNPGVVLVPPSTQVTFPIPITLFVIANNPAPGSCGVCNTPASPTSARIEIELVSLSLQSVATATISTGDGNMTLPAASPGGSFNSYSVDITVPAGTAPASYTLNVRATVNFSDGLALRQSSNSMICLVEPAPGNPSVPRLNVQLLSGSFPRVAGGDQHTAIYEITNNDPTNTVTLDAFANTKQAGVRPQGANETQGVFSISSAFGDDFPIAFGPGPCLPLPGHPYIQPEITMPLPTLAPGESMMIPVRIRAFSFCPSGSCAGVSAFRVEGTFSDTSPAFGCADMALFVDTAQPTVVCLPRTDDCNNNGIPDPSDIANGAPDQNHNGMIDSCEAGNAPIIPNPVQINPTTVMPGQPIQVNVTAFPDFGMPSTNVIMIVFANGIPLTSKNGIQWSGMIPADTRPGPQTVYALAKQQNNGAGATHIGVYTVLPMPLAPTAASSRKTHGSAGTFDVNLPLSGEPGVECRAAGAGGSHTMVIPFNNPVVSGNAAVTSGTGSLAGAPVFFNNTITVNLTGVADVQKITVTLNNVTDTFGQVLPPTEVSMNVLAGDTNGNKTVNSSDIGETKGQSGVAVTSANFRQDVTSNGAINASDIGLVKSRSGNTLPK